ncbi:MAG: protein kinase [Alphaproteobacteria bacterium]|nr:protein kinase [Alphaproteobacteria bacterium]
MSDPSLPTVTPAAPTVDALRIDSNGTVHPPHTAPPLPSSKLEFGLVMGGLLGEGGMGVVTVARQLELDREVAVKRSRDARWEDDLAQEARIMGGLEHPAIVPVHALSRDEQGALRLVMKRIEGRRWSEVLADVDSTHTLSPGRDPLVFHLEVLLTVAEAVAYAHDRGIVHRDLKPDNVMVGRYGEVFVVDWGLAVSTRPGRGLPLASDVRHVAGTPAFMAPEQAMADGARIGPASDIYALGGILHLLLTNRLPHEGDGPREQLVRAASGRPLDTSELPKGLASVVSRATRAAPSERYASAQELATAVRQWLDGRSTERLLSEATRLRSELENQVWAVERRDGDADAARRMLTEARFAWRQILETRPSRVAADGLDATLHLGVRLALAERDPRGAKALLSELGAAHPEMTRRVERLEQALRDEKSEVGRLRTFRDQLDVRPGAIRRGFIGSVVGSGVGAMCVVLGWLDAGLHPLRYPEVLAGLLLFDVAVAVGLIVPYLWSATRAVRRLRMVVATLTLAITLHWVSAWLTGLTIREAVVGNALLSATVLAAGAWGADLWLLLGAAPYGLAWLVGVLLPSAAFFAFGVATAVSFTSYAMFSGIAEAITPGQEEA